MTPLSRRFRCVPKPVRGATPVDCASTANDVEVVLVDDEREEVGETEALLGPGQEIRQ